MADEEFETTDAGASKTEKVESQRLKNGSLVMIKGFPCKVTEVSTAKPGKHGSAKVILKGKDILTGKTYRAHDFGDEGSRQAPVIYYFRLTRQDDGTVEFVPHLIDDQAGIGRQLVSGDLNGDELVDFVVGNKNGAFAFTQRMRKVNQQEWEEAQPAHIVKFKN